MKFIFILIAVIYCSIQGKAQQKNIFKNNPMEEYKKKQELSKLMRNMHSMINNDSLSQKLKKVEQKNWVVKAPLTSTYAGNNGKGADIYKMEPYHMPCLVPDKTFKSNMPVAGYEPAAKSPVSPLKELEKENKENK